MLPINLFIDTFGHRLFDSVTFFDFLAVNSYSWVYEKWESSWPLNNISNNIENQPIWKHKFYEELFCDI